MGSILTIFFSLIVVSFFYTRFIAWQNQADLDILTTIKESYFDFNTKFNSTQGLFLAAAITQYDSNTTLTEDPAYGELVIEHYGWGYSDNISSSERLVDNHFCSEEELGLVKGPNTLVYPTVYTMQNEVNTFKKKFKCVNPDDLVIWGDYNS